MEFLQRSIRLLVPLALFGCGSVPAGTQIRTEPPLNWSGESLGNAGPVECLSLEVQDGPVTLHRIDHHVSDTDLRRVGTHQRHRVVWTATYDVRARTTGSDVCTPITQTANPMGAVRTACGVHPNLGHAQRIALETDVHGTSHLLVRDSGPDEQTLRYLRCSGGQIEAESLLVSASSIYAFSLALDASYAPHVAFVATEGSSPVVSGATHIGSSELFYVTQDSLHPLDPNALDPRIHVGLEACRRVVMHTDTPAGAESLCALLVDVDADELHSAMAEACLQGDGVACLLGAVVSEGLLLELDVSHRRTQYALSTTTTSRRLPPSDPSARSEGRRFRWLNESCELGVSAACNTLTAEALIANPSRARGLPFVRATKSACQEGHTLSCNILMASLNAFSGGCRQVLPAECANPTPPSDEVRESLQADVFETFSRACGNGTAIACFHAWRLADDGTAALRLLRRACELGQEDACQVYIADH